MRLIRILAAAIGIGLPMAGASAEPLKIEWWHGMGGALGQALETIVGDFNSSQSEYSVTAIYKGSYTETLTAAIAAYRTGQNIHPSILQVFDAGTATMMAADNAVYPVHQLFSDAGVNFDQSKYIPAVLAYYSTGDGRLLSMPFNSSTPVFYWNKELFKQAGLDPEEPPRTWPEVGEAAAKLVASGVQCGFVPQWQTWALMENQAAWHNVPYATNDNGFEGPAAELLINKPFFVKHIGAFAEWSKDKRFVYGGREGKSTELFNSKTCAMHLASSGSAAGIRAAVGKENVGMTMMPFWPDVIDKPQNSFIGGATNWVLQGKTPQEYKAVATFFTYLGTAEVQAKYHQITGYVPITLAAADLTRAAGFYDANPGLDIAAKQLGLNTPTPNSRGVRLGNFPQVRDIVDEELEAVWSGTKTAQQALDRAVERGNRIIARYKQ